MAISVTASEPRIMHTVTLVGIIILFLNESAAPPGRSTSAILAVHARTGKLTLVSNFANQLDVKQIKGEISYVYTRFGVVLGFLRYFCKKKMVY